jgi:endonuclease YncB( thermonuclease family)
MRTPICTSIHTPIINDIHDDILDNQILYNDTICFVPDISKGRVIRIFDGDTCMVAAKLPYTNSPLFRFTISISGINCPELRGNTDDEKSCAQLAKLELTDLIMGRVVDIVDLHNGQSNKLEGDLYIQNIQVSELLVRRRLAIRSIGYSNTSPKSWITYHRTGKTG